MLTIQTQPNRWSCLPTAFAMGIGIPVKQIFDYLGHDGSEIIWPEFPEPKKRKAFHIQEMIDFSLTKDVCPVHIEVNPISATEVNLIFHKLGQSLEKGNLETSQSLYREIQARMHNIKTDPNRITNYLNRYKSIALGILPTGTLHAVAWDRNLVYDPNGVAYSVEEYEMVVKDLWLLIPF